MSSRSTVFNLTYPSYALMNNYWGDSRCIRETAVHAREVCGRQLRLRCVTGFHFACAIQGCQEDFSSSIPEGLSRLVAARRAHLSAFCTPDCWAERPRAFDWKIRRRILPLGVTVIQVQSAWQQIWQTSSESQTMTMTTLPLCHQPKSHKVSCLRPVGASLLNSKTD